MHLNEYQELAHKTTNHKLPHNERLLVSALGLVGEAVEVLEAVHDYDLTPDKLRKELGDVAWYVADIGTGLSIPMGILEPSGYSGVYMPASARNLAVHAKNASELLKKHLGHGHTLDRELLCSHLRAVMRELCRLATVEGVGGLTSVLQANIDKLRERYPDGFATEASVNRVDTHGLSAAHGTVEVFKAVPDTNYAEGEARNV